MEQLGNILKAAMASTMGRITEHSVCSECGGPRTATIDMFGQAKIVPVMCPCMVEADRQQRELDAEADRRRKLESLRRYSMMDEAFEGIRFDNSNFFPESEPLLRMAQRYCDNWKEMRDQNIGMTLQGPPGSGKTHLAFCIANELLGRGIPVMALSTIGLINRIYDSYGKAGEYGEAELIRQLQNADLLVLDDLGAEHSGKSGKDKQIIYSVLDARVRAGKPLIITTNLDKKGLEDHLTGADGVKRTFDRLIAAAPTIPVILAKEHWRRRDIGKEKHKTLQEMQR